MDAQPAQNFPLWKRMKAAHYGARKVLGYFNIERPAIDVHGIVTALGIQVYEVVNPGWSGAARVQDDQAVIWLDSSSGVNSGRFTLAHELGHLMLHAGIEHVCPANASQAVSELQAHAFAGELLMPEEAVHCAIYSGISSAYDLASAFKVSPEAMHWRLGKLGLR